MKKFIIGVAIFIVGGLFLWIISDIIIPNCGGGSSPPPPEHNTSAQTHIPPLEPLPNTTPTPPPDSTPTPIPTPDPTPTLESSPSTEPTTDIIPLSALRNIASGSKIIFWEHTERDNYGTEYRGSYYGSRSLISDRPTYTVLLDGKYTRFQAVYYVREGETSERSGSLTITLDDIEIFHTTLDKTSRPVDIDVDVSNGNVFSLEIMGQRTLSTSGISTLISDAIFLP
jgi:hypothetical protein